jgi:ATP-dependent DNA helicase Rep/DNA helicase-2/ATP-dependent DNA helicase PcrA
VSDIEYLNAAESDRANPEQWAAYVSKGNCVILAGPGSGKTKTITIKIAQLLTEDVLAPRRIACITYSNACVAEIGARIRQLKIEDESRLSLSSVHSFCLTELVMPYGRLAGLQIPDPIVVATPSQQREVFKEAQLASLGSEQKPWFRTACDRLRRTILDRTSAEWRRWDSRQTAVVEAYEDGLLARGLIDYDGMLLSGVKLIEDHAWVRQVIKAKFPVIVIDEYQDLGLPLHRMVLALMNKAKVRIVAVGDPDQSIYGFTGANPVLLKSLCLLPEVESIQLRLNYRCAENIITASKSLLPAPDDFKSHDGRNGLIQFHKVEQSITGQAKYALSTLVPNLLKQNPTWKPGDIDFLYPTKNEGSAISECADALGLQYFRSDNGSPLKRSRLIEWLIDAARWCSTGWATGEVNLSQLLKSWRKMRQTQVSDRETLVERARLATLLFAMRDGNIQLQEWLSALFSSVLKPAIDQETGLADEEDNVLELLNACNPQGAFSNYTVEVFGNQGKDPKRFNFITLHGSKGLEFQAVIMIGLEEGVFPSSMVRTEEEMSEVSRQFYVGVTRAKSQVHLMFNQKESPLLTKVRAAVTI